MNPSPPPLAPNEVVTWVRVEAETFDIVGVILSSLGFTLMCLGVAFLLGGIAGFGLILRRRRLDARDHPQSLLLES